MIGEVAAKHGIRLEPSDPAFALVTLNQLVLEETSTKLAQNLSTTLSQFADSLDKVERRAGSLVAQGLKTASVGCQNANSGIGLARPMWTVDQPARTWKWATIGMFLGSLLIGVGITLGLFLARR